MLLISLFIFFVSLVHVVNLHYVIIVIFPIIGYNINLPILVHVPAVIMLTFTLLLLCSAVSKKTISFTAIPFRGAFLLFFIHFSSTHLHEEKNNCTWITISWSKSCIFLLSVSLPGWAIELATTFI